MGDFLGRSTLIAITLISAPITPTSVCLVSDTSHGSLSSKVLSGLHCTSPLPEMPPLNPLMKDHYLSLKSLPKLFLHIKIYPRNQLGNVSLGEQATVVVDVLFNYRELKK